MPGIESASADPRLATVVTGSAPPRPRRVPSCPLAEVAALLGLPQRPPGAVSGVTHASSQVRPGDLYAALPGAHRHGGEFAAQAAAAGAAAVLTDPAGAVLAADTGLPVLVVPDPRARLGHVAARVYGDPSTRLAVIGITGTAGKTTAAYLVHAGLVGAGRVPALLGTVETRLGGAGGDWVVDSVRTTPEATDLHALLAVAEERGVDTVVMEVSSHALALGRVGGVRFAVGAYTNFGQDHLDFHRDLDDYFSAKAQLFDGRCATEVLNYDDPALAPLRTRDTVTYSAAGAPQATWHAEDVAVGADGFQQRFAAVGPYGSVTAGVGQPGRHSVANALLAIAALVATGVDAPTAAAGVATGDGVPGRLERIGDGTTGPLGVVDYAHKPDAVAAALAALRGAAARRGGRLICVLGAGGDRDAGKRPAMGAAAAAGADLVVITDDNPRSEDPAAIRAAVRAGAGDPPAPEASAQHPRPPAEVIEVAGRRAGIVAAVARAAAADVVAVLGKGHERGQEVAGYTYPFDDRVELARALGIAVMT